MRPRKFELVITDLDGEFDPSIDETGGSSIRAISHLTPIVGMHNGLVSLDSGKGTGKSSHQWETTTAFPTTSHHQSHHGRVPDSPVHDWLEEAENNGKDLSAGAGAKRGKRQSSVIRPKSRPRSTDRLMRSEVVLRALADRRNSLRSSANAGYIERTYSEQVCNPIQASASKASGRHGKKTELKVDHSAMNQTGTNNRQLTIDVPSTPKSVDKEAKSIEIAIRLARQSVRVEQWRVYVQEMSREYIVMRRVVCCVVLYA